MLAGFWRPERVLPWIGKAPWLSTPKDKPEPDRDNKTYPVEAFCWGGLTSGDWSRSLWILLAPFALGNAAGWMHEPKSVSSQPCSDERAKAPYQKLIATWFSFSLTVMLMWMFVYLALDLVAFRCGWMVAECRSNHGWLRAIVDWSHGEPHFPFVTLGGGIGRLMIVATLVPLLVLLLIYLAGRASFRDYEMFHIVDEPMPGAVGRDMPDHTALGLRNHFFWQNDRPVRRLQRLHLATGVAATQAGLAAVMAHVSKDTEGETNFRALLWVGLAVIGVNLWIASFSAIFRRGPRSRGPADVLPVVTFWLAVALLAWTMFVTWGAPTNLELAKPTSQQCPSTTSCLQPVRPPEGVTPIFDLQILAFVLTGIQTTFVLAMLGRARGSRWRLVVTEFVLLVLFVVMVVAPVLNFRWKGLWEPFKGVAAVLDERFGRFTVWSAIVLLLLTVVSRRRFGFGKAFLGIGPSALSAIAGFSLGSFWAGTGALVADTLDGGGTGIRLNPPKWFSWVATSFAALIGLVLLAFVILSVTTKRRRAGHNGVEADRKAVEKQFPPDEIDKSAREDPSGHATRVKKIAKAYRWRRIVARADRALALCEIVVLSLAVGQVVSFLIKGDTSSEENPAWYLALSNAVVLALPVVLFLGMRWAFNSAAGRRGVGAVWDVVTFFPRTFHPFAPPCYAERAVPQLAFRLKTLTRAPSRDELPVEAGPDDAAAEKVRRGVVLRSHSQGTVLAVASVLQFQRNTDAAQSDRLRMLTFGSPLTVLYARVFPSYFGGLVGSLAQSLPESAGQRRWLHFRARTDPLGTKLFGYCDPTNPWFGPYPAARDIDPPIPDPPRWARIPGEEDPPMGGHSTYWKHPKVDATVAMLAGDLNEDPSLIDWAKDVQ